MKLKSISTIFKLIINRRQERDGHTFAGRTHTYTMYMYIVKLHKMFHKIYESTLSAVYFF